MIDFAISVAMPHCIGGSRSVTHLMCVAFFLLFLRRATSNISFMPVSADNALEPMAFPDSTVTATMSSNSLSTNALVDRHESANAALSGRTNPILPPRLTFFAPSTTNDAAMPARRSAGIGFLCLSGRTPWSEKESDLPSTIAFHRCCVASR